MIKTSLLHRLDVMLERHEELSALLSTPEIINNQNQFRELSKEFAQLEPLVLCYKGYKKVLEDIIQAEEMAKEEDADMRLLAKEELDAALSEKEKMEDELQILLLPTDPDDNKDVYLEIRAGTGGDEAAIFSGDLYRMYTRYAERQGWRYEVVSANPGEHGGFKEIIVQIAGQGVYSKLKFESGAHRVQRVPETESQGRVHTSACTVAIMAVVEEVDEVDINPSDLKIDTYRASGAGGQHVNKTDSAIRITHLPTGVVVECQDERSQHKNRAKAMSLLQSKLLTAEREKQQAEQAQTRKSLVGSGDRSERIRTYNFPQGRLTDHRINLTLYKLADIMEGELSQVVDPLVREYQAELLTALSEQND